jgi:hypothetical protein
MGLEPSFSATFRPEIRGNKNLPKAVFPGIPMWANLGPLNYAATYYTTEYEAQTTPPSSLIVSREIRVRYVC